MKKIQEDKMVTFEQALTMPEYAQFHDAIRYLEKTPSKDVFPQKYEASIKGLTNRKVQSLFEENPSMSLKNVLTSVIQNLPDDLSTKLLLNMTHLTIRSWDKLSKSHTSEKKIPQLA
jgi:hypothetical protein